MISNLNRILIKSLSADQTFFGLFKWLLIDARSIEIGVVNQP